jgi:hypothetical protein
MASVRASKAFFVAICRSDRVNTSSTYPDFGNRYLSSLAFAFRRLVVDIGPETHVFPHLKDDPGCNNRLPEFLLGPGKTGERHGKVTRTPNF